MGRGIRWPAFAILAVALAGGCNRVDPPRLGAVRALRNGVRPAFRAPADGLLQASQVDLFVKVRARNRGVSLGEAVAAIGADPVEFAWVRARIQEAILALEADRVAAASAESYARGIAVLREARKTARDPKTAARIDAEIATLERERATLRRAGAGAAQLSRNAAIVAPRRAEIEAAGP